MDKPESAPAVDDIGAVGAIVTALRPFDEDKRQRIIDSALALLGVKSAPRGVPLNREPAVMSDTMSEHAPDTEPPAPRDIRELAAQKQPRTANEMAAVTAYYLSKLVLPAERRDFITSSDIKTYFDQANFHQPGDPIQTLRNAKNAGFFDALGDGKYRLSPVGHNLVKFNLPKSGAARKANGPRRRRARHPSKKRASTGSSKPRR